jgi:hypothetical protein
MNTMNPINVFNRILLLVLGALALIVGIITLLLVTQAIRPADVSPGGLLFDQWSGIAALSGGAATTAAIVGTLLALAGLALIVLELVPGRREPPSYVVRKDGLGQVRVARKSVSQVVQYEAGQIDGIREVRPEVRNSADGLHVIAHASLAPDAAAATVGEQLQTTIRESVQRQIGLPVAEVQVHTQVESLDAPRRVR